MKMYIRMQVCAHICMNTCNMPTQVRVHVHVSVRVVYVHACVGRRRHMKRGAAVLGELFQTMKTSMNVST